MVIRTLFVYRALAFIDAAVECDNTCAGYVRRVTHDVNDSPSS